MKDTRTNAQKNGHAVAIVTKAEQTARADWGNGWARLSDEQRRALVCMHTIDVLTLERVRKSASVSTLLHVFALLRRSK